jgi:hypothetical protein
VVVGQIVASFGRSHLENGPPFEQETVLANQTRELVMK